MLIQFQTDHFNKINLEIIEIFCIPFFILSLGNLVSQGLSSYMGLMATVLDKEALEFSIRNRRKTKKEHKERKIGLFHSHWF